MLPDVSEEQRHAIHELGLPLPVMDRKVKRCFMLIRVEVLPDALGGFMASIPGIDAIGAGKTVEEAMLALGAVLQVCSPFSG
jgi:hypothetical protein